MRQKILNKLIASIKLKLKYEDEKLIEIKYGLETLYITISKQLLL